MLQNVDILNQTLICQDHAVSLEELYDVKKEIKLLLTKLFVDENDIILNLVLDCLQFHSYYSIHKFMTNIFKI